MATSRPARFATRTVVAGLLCLPFWLGGGPARQAWAAPAAAPRASEQQAAELFKESERAYLAGHFDRAVALLDRAYALHPSPILLYNRARSLEGLGDLAGAVASYRRYLGDERRVIDRGAIEQRIATLEHQLRERAALTERREQAERARAEAESRLQRAPTPVAPPRPSAARRAAPWILAGVGVAGLAIGTGLGVAADSDRSSAIAQESADGAQRSQRSAVSLALGANVCFIAGGVLAGAGLVWGTIEAVRSRRLRR